MKHLSTYGWKVIYHLRGMPVVVLVVILLKILPLYTSDGTCISNVGEDVGRDEYTDQRHGRFRKIKSVAWSAVGA